MNRFSHLLLSQNSKCRSLIYCIFILLSSFFNLFGYYSLDSFK